MPSHCLRERLRLQNKVKIKPKRVMKYRKSKNENKNEHKNKNEIASKQVMTHALTDKNLRNSNIAPVTVIERSRFCTLTII